MTTWNPPTERPYLYTNPAELAGMRRRLQAGEPAIRTALAALRAQARRAAEEPLPTFDHAFAVPLVFEGWHDAYTAVTRQGYWLHRDTEPALAAALVWRLADDEAALQACRRVLLHFAAGYIFDIEQYDAAMNDAVFGVPLLYAYDLTWDQYAPLERQLIERFFADMAGHILAGDKFWSRNHIGGDYNNHYAFHKLGMLCYGLHANRPEYVDYCFRPPFGLDEMLAHGLVDDGLSLECSLGYHFAVGMPVLLAGRALRLAGWPRDILATREDGARSWRDLYLSILNLLLPDGALPVVGDNYGELPALPRAQYALACEAWRDPRLAWALGRSAGDDDWLGQISRLLPGTTAAGTPPRPATRLWPEHGYALLVREGTGGYFGDASAACFVSFGYGGIHGHYDKLHCELCAGGVRWLTDAEGVPAPGQAAMTSRINEGWNRSTCANNTVVVDYKLQNWLKGNLAVSAWQPDACAITLLDDAGALYAGVRQERALRLADGRLLDRFILSSDDEHTYDYFLHLAAGAELELPPALMAQGSAGAGPAYAWLQAPRAMALPAGGITLRARKDGRAFSLHLRCNAPAELWTAVSSADEPGEKPGYPAVWLRCQARDVVFSGEFVWQDE